MIVCFFLFFFVFGGRGREYGYAKVLRDYRSMIPMLPWWFNYSSYVIVTILSVNWFPGEKSSAGMISYPEENLAGKLSLLSHDHFHSNYGINAVMAIQQRGLWARPLLPPGKFEIYDL